jgi:hypothetical protein
MADSPNDSALDRLRRQRRRRVSESEFEGNWKGRSVPPLPHEPTASERLQNLYRTGSEDGDLPYDDGEAFRGEIKE